MDLFPTGALERARQVTEKNPVVILIEMFNVIKRFLEKKYTVFIDTKGLRYIILLNIVILIDFLVLI